MKSSEVKTKKRKRRKIIKVKHDTDYVEFIEAQMINLALPSLGTGQQKETKIHSLSSAVTMFVVLLLVDLSNFYYSFISARNESLAR